MACKTCKSRRSVPTVFAQSATPSRMVRVSCTNCAGVMVTSAGISIPLATGDWYHVQEGDLVRWISEGRVFEFDNINDAIYLQDKYAL